MKNSVLTINLTKLKENVNEIAKEIKPAKIIPVLKGNAYGLGVEQITKAIEQTGLVDIFAVSHISEGLEMRKYTKKQIWILSSPIENNIQEAVDADLVLTIGRLGLISIINMAAKKSNRVAKIQLKVETGLHRIGLEPGKEIDEFIKELKNVKNVELVGAFSHFSTDTLELMDKQYKEYQKGIVQLEKAGYTNLIKHMACSSSIEKTNKYNLDAVRIGRRLYMDNPITNTGKIKEICTYKSYLTAVHARKKGDTLGYGGKFILDNDCVVGTIGIGYGDGYLSELFHSHVPVLINGKRCPLLTTCMDQSFVLLDDVEAKADDEVIFFNEDTLTSQEVAWMIGEEGCAITANLNSRVEKEYK